MYCTVYAGFDLYNIQAVVRWPFTVIANENFLLEEKKSKDESAKLRNENQKLRDEIATLQNLYQKLGNQDEKLRDETEKLQEKIIDLITCQICFERFQSAGERTPCKLRCPHIMCKKCAEDWLKMVSSFFHPKSSSNPSEILEKTFEDS